MTGIDVCGRILENDIADGVIHGAAVIAGSAYGATVRANWGWADPAHAIPMSTNTIIDVASVTKVAAGITAYLVVHAKGGVDFDAPFTDFLHEYSSPLAHRITLRDLANHVSGFGEADGWPYSFFDPADPQRTLRLVLSLPPGEPVPGKVAYSCRNYVLLAQCFERLSGRGVAEFCASEIFGPAGMEDTTLGTLSPGMPKERLAYTMTAPGPGEISDFLARPLWKAGFGTFNAGLFSTAEDLATLMRLYLRGGVCNNGTRLFGETEMAEIAPNPANRVDGARHFGWQSFSPLLPQEFAGSALFHTGWSGQTVLFDTSRDFFAVVVTTRCGDYDRAKHDRFAAISALLRSHKQTDTFNQFSKDNS